MKYLSFIIALVILSSCSTTGTPYLPQGNLLVVVVDSDYSVIEFAETNTNTFSGSLSIPFVESVEHDNAFNSFHYFIVSNDTLGYFYNGLRNLNLVFQNQANFDQSTDLNNIHLNTNHFDIYSNSNLDANQVWESIKKYEIVQGYFEQNILTKFSLIKVVESVNDPTLQVVQPTVRYYILIPGN
ncbi:MAG: hypothetical protein R2799_02840 [Crocinitomicaceae bacterium]